MILSDSNTTASRGALIVVEGGDRCGKTSQCSVLVNHLCAAGFNVMAHKFPDRTLDTGVLIDQYLRGTKEVDDHAIHLLFSANRWESMGHIKSLIDQGITIVVDRYAFSGAAYTAAKGIDLEWCKRPDMGLLKPDLVLYLDLDPKIAAARAEYGSERYETIEFQAAVRRNFYQIADDSWKFVDANRTVEAISTDMISTVLQTIKDVKSKPILSNLWEDNLIKVSN
ncbi:hypothetical protein BDV3_000634 [Batrachochytrium dendrobatidis]